MNWLMSAKTEQELDAAWDTAHAVARVAAKKFALAQTAYRNRSIGDTEFLAAKADYDESTKALDAARGETPPEAA